MTPDLRYIVVRGRLWRRADPRLPEPTRQRCVDALMAARRAVAAALRSGDQDGLRAARASVQTAKITLGERGPVWWDDGAPDYSRRMVRNTPYAPWYEDRVATAARAAAEPAPSSQRERDIAAR